MRKRTLLLRVAGGAGTLLVLLFASALLLPHLLDIRAIESKTASFLKDRYRIHPTGVAIGFFPYPRITFTNSTLSVPGLVEASAESATVYPRLLSLLKGELRAGKVMLIRPVVSANLDRVQTLKDQEKSGEQDGAEKPAEAALPVRVKEGIGRACGFAASVLPGADIEVEDCRLELSMGEGAPFQLADLDLRAVLLPDGCQLELNAGKSSLWSALSFSGRIGLPGGNSSGQLTVAGAQARDFFASAFPNAARRVSSGLVDAAVSFTATGPDAVRAEFSLTLPSLVLGDGAEPMALDNGSIAGALDLDGSRFSLALSRVRFVAPLFDFSGKLTVDRATGAAALDLEGRDTDAAAVRRAALAAGGENPVVNRIFKIVREGHVPEITFSARADTLSGLGRPENFIIRGSMRDGKILAPKAELMVEQASGDVVISGGILEASNLQGTTASSAATAGHLRVGLGGGDAQFHLDLSIDADLAELPPVLERVVSNETFRRELATVKDVEGRARGRLLLGESLRSVRVNVETGPFELSGRYGRFSDPVRLGGESFRIDGPRITAALTSARTGRSAAARTTFGFGWDEGHPLAISTQEKATVGLDLLVPLGLMREQWRQVLAGGESSLKGTVVFDSFEFSGPLSAPSAWSLTAKGSAEDVSAQTTFFAQPVFVKSGRFEASRDVLSLTDFQTRGADSKLSLSGSLTGYLDTLRSADLAISGEVGPEGSASLAVSCGLPSQLKSVSHMKIKKSRLLWEKAVQTSFQGELRAGEGPAVSLDVQRTYDELFIRNLTVRDESSHASLALRVRPDEFSMDFYGTLSGRTADRVFVENRLLTGFVRGKMRARVFPAKPMDSTAEGQIQVSGLEFPWRLKTPARIENGEIEARGNRAAIKSAVIAWNESRLEATGTVALASDSFNVNADLSADTLRVEDILEMKNGETEAGAKTGASTPSGKAGKLDAPVRGALRIKTSKLTYGKYAWTSVDGEAALGPGGQVDISLKKADLCGISTPARISVSPEGVSLWVRPEAADQDLDNALGCLLGKKDLITGKFGIKGELSALAPHGGSLVEALQGNIEFMAHNGRFHRFGSLSKIFALLNLTEIYRGQLPDLVTEGCAYDTIKMGGAIKDGKLTLSDSSVEGPCVKIAWRGEADLSTKKVDLVAVVAPMKTVDRIVGLVPGLGKVLNDSLISVPVEVKGDLDNPSVVPLSPSAVGSELLGAVKRTFKLPFTLFEPVF